MPEFIYQALDSSGRQTQGKINAKTKSEVYRQLEQARLQPVSIVASVSSTDPKKEAQEDSANGEPLVLNQKQLIYFSEELSDLLDAGVQLESALQIISTRQESGAIQKLASRVRQQVREGVRLSVALKNNSKSFDELYCSLVAAGELSGSLPKILLQQTQYLIAINDLKNKVVQAMIYPCFIVAAGIALMLVFLTFLVPQLSVLFDRADATMPWSTKLLIDTSALIRDRWWVFLIVIGSGSFGFYQFIQTPSGREWWDKFKLDIPLFGPILRSRFYAQFCFTLATLLNNGLPMMQGLSILKGSTPNVFIRKNMEHVISQVAEGRSLSKSLTGSAVFPSHILDMIRVGEQTGEMGKALEKTSKRFEKEMEKKIQRLTALIQPTIIVILALVIGSVVLSILTSIFQAMSQIRS